MPLWFFSKFVVNHDIWHSCRHAPHELISKGGRVLRTASFFKRECPKLSILFSGATGSSEKSIWDRLGWVNPNGRIRAKPFVFTHNGERQLQFHYMFWRIVNKKTCLFLHVRRHVPHEVISKRLEGKCFAFPAFPECPKSHGSKHLLDRNIIQAWEDISVSGMLFFCCASCY